MLQFAARIYVVPAAPLVLLPTAPGGPPGASTRSAPSHLNDGKAPAALILNVLHILPQGICYRYSPLASCLDCASEVLCMLRGMAWYLHRRVHIQAIKPQR